MKTTFAALASLVIIGLSQISSAAASYTYVFVPQTNQALTGFDRELAAATITLNTDLGFFNGTAVSFTAYPGVQLDPITLDLEDTATATGLNISSGGILASSKTYFTNDEQLKTDAEFDGKWIIATSVSVPEAGTTLSLLVLSLIAFPVWWTFSRR
jgi:hypothetical protein